jgi:hypothetical protein
MKNSQESSKMKNRRIQFFAVLVMLAVGLATAS